MTDRQRADRRPGAIFAHFDDESVTAAGALALAHDAAELCGCCSPGRSGQRRALRTSIWPIPARRRCAAPLQDRDGRGRRRPSDGRLRRSTLVDEIPSGSPTAAGRSSPSGAATNDADHAVVGAATSLGGRRLAESGLAPTPYVVAPVFGPGTAATTSPRRRGPPATGSSRGRRPQAAAPACHASQTDVAEEINEARCRARPRGVTTRATPASAPPSPRRVRPSPASFGGAVGGSAQFLLDWSAMTIDSNLIR